MGASEPARKTAGGDVKTDKSSDVDSKLSLFQKQAEQPFSIAVSEPIPCKQIENKWMNKTQSRLMATGQHEAFAWNGKFS